MKKVLTATIAIAALMAAVLALTEKTQATPQVKGGLTQVLCLGNDVNMFLYRVKPKSPITKVEIGTGSNDLNAYTNLVMPPGWSMSIVNIQRKHAQKFTQHGLLTGPSGKCKYLIRWTGPAQSNTFDLGYDFTMSWDNHDVNWKTNDKSKAQWTFPVGTGFGPVHAPWRP